MNSFPLPQFRCIGCGATFPVEKVIYACERCGELLEVEHPRSAWRSLSPKEWQRRFGERRLSPQPTDQSGVWRFREWVMPIVEEEEIVTLGEGNTPLVALPQLARKLTPKGKIWLKQCGISHTGSFKDLGMTVLISMVNRLRRKGTPIPAVICASTGDTSAALASYGAYAQIPTVVLLPQGKVTLSQLLQPVAHGALVLEVETDFDGCMALVQELVQRYGLYLANSKNSLRIEGQKTVAYEIVEALGYNPPHWIVIPGGNLGNVSALAKGLLDLEAVGLLPFRPRIACVQVESADPLYRSYIHGWAPLEPVAAGETQATAIRIGNPVSFKKAVSALKAFSGVVLRVSEEELAQAAHQVDRMGMYTCPHTGVALAGLFQLHEKGELPPDARAVVISTAHGLKFSEFKRAYHSGEVPFPTPYRNPSVVVPPDPEKAFAAIRQRFSL